VLRQLWQLFRQRFPSRVKALLVLATCALGLLLVSAALVVGGAAGLAWTETEKFCISCHEMRDNVYAEYKDTIHAKNRSGVRAICSDCHVPREPVALIKRKIAASGEVWGHLTGEIDTAKKFEAARHALAMRVWKRMKESDSIECRNCHTESAMDPDKQSEKAKARHAKGHAEGKTCIDCHYGIAHKEPEGPGPQEMTPEIMKSIRGG
jgi:cytochrome c-type protein NapC